jgi:SAM-dependent methyltransferase
MVGIASRRLHDRARILVADASKPLSFLPAASIDLIVASLVLHYVRDWVGVLAEWNRVLAPGGAAVFSTHHPALDWQLHTADDYFAVKQVTESWTMGGGEFPVTYWRRPLTAMTEAIAVAGFVIEALIEPEPISDLRERNPTAYGELRRSPGFLFFRLLPRVPG